MKNNENKVVKKPSTIKARLKVQEILDKNIRNATGLFHGKELNERCFVSDLFKNFHIIIKTDDEKQIESSN